MNRVRALQIGPKRGHESETEDEPEAKRVPPRIVEWQGYSLVFETRNEYEEVATWFFAVGYPTRVLMTTDNEVSLSISPHHSYEFSVEKLREFLLLVIDMARYLHARTALLHTVSASVSRMMIIMDSVGLSRLERPSYIAQGFLPENTYAMNFFRLLVQSEVNASWTEFAGMTTRMQDPHSAINWFWRSEDAIRHELEDGDKNHYAKMTGQGRYFPLSRRPYTTMTKKPHAQLLAPLPAPLHDQLRRYTPTDVSFLPYRLHTGETDVFPADTMALPMIRYPFQPLFIEPDANTMLVFPSNGILMAENGAGAFGLLVDLLHVDPSRYDTFYRQLSVQDQSVMNSLIVGERMLRIDQEEILVADYIEQSKLARFNIEAGYPITDTSSIRMPIAMEKYARDEDKIFDYLVNQMARFMGYSVVLYLFRVGGSLMTPILMDVRPVDEHSQYIVDTLVPSVAVPWDPVLPPRRPVGWIGSPPMQSASQMLFLLLPTILDAETMTWNNQTLIIHHRALFDGRRKIVKENYLIKTVIGKSDVVFRYDPTAKVIEFYWINALVYEGENQLHFDALFDLAWHVSQHFQLNELRIQGMPRVRGMEWIEHIVNAALPERPFVISRGFLPEQESWVNLLYSYYAMDPPLPGPSVWHDPGHSVDWVWKSDAERNRESETDPANREGRITGQVQLYPGSKRAFTSMSFIIETYGSELISRLSEVQVTELRQGHAIALEGMYRRRLAPHPGRPIALGEHTMGYPATRYAKGMNQSFFYDEELVSEGQFCGTFFYMEPDSTVLLTFDDRRSLHAFNKADAFVQLWTRVHTRTAWVRDMNKQLGVDSYQKWAQRMQPTDVQVMNARRNENYPITYYDWLMWSSNQAPFLPVAKDRVITRDLVVETMELDMDERVTWQVKRNALKMDIIIPPMGRAEFLYAWEDEFDQVICRMGRLIGIDVIYLQAMMGSYQVVSELLDTRTRIACFNALLRLPASVMEGAMLE